MDMNVTMTSQQHHQLEPCDSRRTQTNSRSRQSSLLPLMALVACQAMILVTIFPTAAQAFVVPHDPDSMTGGWENVHSYRRRKGIEFNYTTKMLSAEVCRDTTEDHCREMDEDFTREALANQRHLQSNSGDPYNVLVVLLQFADHTDRELPDPAVIERLWNADDTDATNYPTGSLRRYFQENSYGKLNIQATVTGWNLAAQNQAYYANGNSAKPINSQPSKITEALIPALDSIDGSMDFFQFDNNNNGNIDVTVIMHTGYAAERGVKAGCNEIPTTDRIQSFAQGGTPGLWTSNSGVQLGSYVTSSVYRGECGENLARLGVTAHETVHTFGIPDLYDLAGPESGFGNVGGIGGYDTMANAGGQSGRQAFPGFLSAWTRMKLGWLEPIEIQVDGTYVAQNAETTKDVYMIKKPYASGEYLLIENRQPLSFDEKIWDGLGGVLIYHIDDTVNSWLGDSGNGNKFRGYPGQAEHPGWPGTFRHYQVALLQADRLYEQEKALNNGHAQDFWRQGAVLGVGPGTDVYNGNPNDYPNTDSYSFNSGGIRKTNLVIDNFQETQAGIWSFDVGGLVSDVPPTESPTRPPTEPPSKAPTTTAPTSAPTRRPTSSPTDLPTATPRTDSPTRQPTTSSPTDPDATNMPTASPTHVPTSSPTASPTFLPTVSAAPTGGCCSRNFRDCDAPVSCGFTEEECLNCIEDPTVLWKPRGAEQVDSCVARFEPCNAAPADCCGPVGILSCSIPASSTSDGNAERLCYSDEDLLQSRAPSLSPSPTDLNPSGAPSIMPTPLASDAPSVSPNVFNPSTDVPASTDQPTAAPADAETASPTTVQQRNSSNNNNNDDGMSNGVIAGIVLGSLMGAICCCFIGALLLLRQRNAANHSDDEGAALENQLLDEEEGGEGAFKDGFGEQEEGILPASDMRDEDDESDDSDDESDDIDDESDESDDSDDDGNDDSDDSDESDDRYDDDSDSDPDELTPVV